MKIEKERGNNIDKIITVYKNRNYIVIIIIIIIIIHIYYIHSYTLYKEKINNIA
jgi:hypothetical protein